jgi:outer membrane protein
MSTLNRSIAALALVVCSGLAAQAAHADTKIGVVDLQRLVREAPQTKVVMQALQAKFAPRERELVTMQNDLRAGEDKIQRDSAVMSESDHAAAEKTQQNNQRDFQRKASEYQDEVNQAKNDEINKVENFILQELQSYSAAQGYDIVLVNNGVVFYKTSFDVTANMLAVLASKPAVLPTSATPASPKPAPAKTK